MNYTHLPSISCYYSERPLPSHTDAEAHFEYEMLLITEGEATFSSIIKVIKSEKNA